MTDALGYVNECIEMALLLCFEYLVRSGVGPVSGMLHDPRTRI